MKTATAVNTAVVLIGRFYDHPAPIPSFTDELHYSRKYNCARLKMQAEGRALPSAIFYQQGEMI